MEWGEQRVKEGAREALGSRAPRTLQAILRNLSFTLNDTRSHCKPLNREMIHYDLTFIQIVPAAMLRINSRSRGWCVKDQLEYYYKNPG